jgi:hypothetical protein
MLEWLTEWKKNDFLHCDYRHAYIDVVVQRKLNIFLVFELKSLCLIYLDRGSS